MKNKSKSITIKDLADYLDLSISTVSRALSGNINIARETRERVMDAANKLGYQPNTWAKRMQSGKTGVIGVILPDIDDTFFVEMYKGISSVLKGKGYNVIVAFSEENPEQERECLQLMKQQLVEGIIMCSCHQEYNNAYIKELMKKGVEFAFLDRVPDMPNITKVEIDNYDDTFNLVEYLLEEGYRKIAFIQTPPTIKFSSERYQAYVEAMKKHHFSDNKLIIGSPGMTYYDGKKFASALLERIEEIDAIMTCSDVCAIGIMHELQKHGVRIPQDVAIAGFGGSLATEMVTPEITTIKFPQREMGEKAAELLVKKLDNPEESNRHIKLPTKIIRRASTKRRF